MSTKSKTTGIEIEVKTQYVAEESKPEAHYFFFAYTIQIRNVGSKPAQLVSRYWHITDGWGRVEEVRGDGVIGKQPYIVPGEAFQYTSFCPLMTATGTMRGAYTMVRDNGDEFEVEIPEFFLYEPSKVC